MKTLYLHIGIHKTGSTALQGSMALSQEHLAENDIHYLATAFGTGQHHLLARALLDNDHLSTPRIWNESIEEIARRPESHIVISSEAFDEMNARQIGQLGIILKGLPSNFNIKLIVYLRPQAGLLASQYNQQIKEGYIRISFEEYVESVLHTMPRVFSFRYMLEPWLKTFGEIQVGIAEREYLIGGSIRDDFFERMGKADALDGLQGPQRWNESLNSDAISGFRDVLESESIWSVPFVERKEVFHKFVSQCQKDAMWRPGKNPPLFGKPALEAQIIARCRAVFSEDNAWVAQQFFGGNNILDLGHLKLLEMARQQADDRKQVDEDTRQWVRNSLVERMNEAGYLCQL